MTTKGKSQTTRKRKNDGPPRDLAAKKKHVRELAQAQRWHEIERVYGPKMVERAKQYAEKARGVPAQPPQTPQSLARAILEKNGYTEPPVAEAETVAVVVTPSPEKLNEEQKQQIERKRQEAIARRQQRLQQQRQQQQMYRVQSQTQQRQPRQQQQTHQRQRPPNCCSGPQPDNVPVNKHRQPRQTLLTDYTSGRKAGCPQAKRGLDEYLRNELEAAAAVVEWEDKQQSATEPPNQSCNKVMPPELQADLDAATEIVMWEASQASREFGKNLSSDVLLRQERSQRRMSELDRSQLIEQEVAAAAEALEWEKQLLSATNERSAWSNQPAVAPTVPIEVSDDEKQPTTKHVRFDLPPENSTPSFHSHASSYKENQRPIDARRQAQRNNSANHTAYSSSENRLADQSVPNLRQRESNAQTVPPPEVQPPVRVKSAEEIAQDVVLELLAKYSLEDRLDEVVVDFVDMLLS